MPTMILPSTAHSAAVSLASGGEGTDLTPYFTGIGAFLALAVLLWITTRFNRDR